MNEAFTVTGHKPGDVTIIRINTSFKSKDALLLNILTVEHTPRLSYKTSGSGNRCDLHFEGRDSDNETEVDLLLFESFDHHVYESDEYSIFLGFFKERRRRSCIEGDNEAFWNPEMGVNSLTEDKCAEWMTYQLQLREWKNLPRSWKDDTDKPKRPEGDNPSWIQYNNIWKESFK